MSLIQSIYNYCRYGKVVHRSSSGKVIRKKTDILSPSYKNTIYMETQKTFFDKEGNIEKKMIRKTTSQKDMLSTSTRTEFYDTSTGELKNKIPNTQNYYVYPQEKMIIDYTKPEFRFNVKTPHTCGKEFEVTYPEVTLIKGHKVTTAINKNNSI